MSLTVAPVSSIASLGARPPSAAACRAIEREGDVLGSTGEEWAPEFPTTGVHAQASFYRSNTNRAQIRLTVSSGSSIAPMGAGAPCGAAVTTCIHGGMAQGARWQVDSDPL